MTRFATLVRPCCGSCSCSLHFFSATTIHYSHIARFMLLEWEREPSTVEKLKQKQKLRGFEGVLTYLLGSRAQCDNDEQKDSKNLRREWEERLSVTKSCMRLREQWASQVRQITYIILRLFCKIIFVQWVQLQRFSKTRRWTHSSKTIFHGP